MNLVIRDETTADIATIAAITKAAFATCPYSRQTESFIIAALRRANALTLSLVAENNAKVVGHLAFSPVTIAHGDTGTAVGDGWYGAGPFAVEPALQRQGIGKALMKEAINRLRLDGAKGGVLVGDPKYYIQFGFKTFHDLVVADVPQEFVLALPFQQSNPSGTVIFHEAFTAQA